MNATVKFGKNHFPVLLDELISIISPLYSGTFIDCTFGQGGYSKAILLNLNNKVIAIDRDNKAVLNAIHLKKKFKDNFHFENIKFSEINTLNLNKENIKAIIFDLGYSSKQIQDPEKGLSFHTKGKLNMQMGLNDISAHEVINFLESKDIEKIFKYFGEEKKSKIISKKISLLRQKKIIKTEDLVNLINQSKLKKNSKIHNATKIFQALRIFVNKEISELIFGLINAYKILPVGGMIVAISFHSIEDRIIKFFFKNFSQKISLSRYLPDQFEEKEEKLFKLPRKKPIVPSEYEKKINPPSRSAKLRYAIKVKHSDNFDIFTEKFKYLIDIENLSKKL